MGARTLVAAILLLVPAAAGAQQPATSADPSVYKAYDAILRQYQTGDLDDAVLQLSFWPASRLGREMRPPATITDVGALHAQVMLHTEELLRGVLVDTHYRAARWAMQVLLNGGNLRQEFGTKWAATVGNALLLQDKATLLTNSTLATQIAGWNTDPDLLLLRGSIVEIVWTNSHAYKASREWLKVGGVIVTDKPDEARNYYRKALESNPGFVEARLRLGRVLFLSGDVNGARKELERARAESREPYLLYMSTLFLGQCYEQKKMFRQAEECYRACLRLFPDSQTPYIALGHLLQLTTRNPEAAFDVVRQMFGDDEKRKNPSKDPYWVYSCGQLWRLAQDIAALRTMVRK